MLKLIAAIGENNELGYQNKLLWHLPNDLKFFKEKTLNHTVVMGDKTFESLPRLLPNRKHIVLSLDNKQYEGAKTITNISEFLENYKNEDVFVIGGGTIYKLLLPYTNIMYLTKIEDSKEADTFFPEFNESDWIITCIGENEDNRIKYKHYEYKRRNV